VNQQQQPSQGPGIGLTFLYYFAITSLIGTLLASQARHLSLATGMPNQLGIILGLLGGSIGTYFNRSLSLKLSMGDRQTLLNQLNPIFEALGYTQTDTTDQALIYQRPQWRGLFSGKIYVYPQDHSATIISRAVHIRALKNRLTAL
jgi:hypothetical protein